MSKSNNNIVSLPANAVIIRKKNGRVKKIVRVKHITISEATLVNKNVLVKRKFYTRKYIVDNKTGNKTRVIVAVEHEQFLHVVGIVTPTYTIPILIDRYDAEGLHNVADKYKKKWKDDIALREAKVRRAERKAMQKPKVNNKLKRFKSKEYKRALLIKLSTKRMNRGMQNNTLKYQFNQLMLAN